MPLEELAGVPDGVVRLHGDRDGGHAILDVHVRPLAQSSCHHAAPDRSAAIPARGNPAATACTRRAARMLELRATMYVRDLMRPEVVTLYADDTLDLAEGIMRLGRIRHLPVVSGDRVVGIVSQRDLFRAAVSSLLQLGGEAERKWLAGIPVMAVMTPHVFTVSPSVPLRAAVRIMIDKRIGCLPVVDDGRLVGLLSESDCLLHLADLLAISEEKAALPELAPSE